MRSIPKLLSKTKLMRGYRCQKCIYLTIHRPDLEPPISPEKQALFDQGNRVGEEARKFFPGGVLVDNLPWDFVGAISKTKEFIASGVETIYEAAFEYMGFYARADIIQINPETHRWHIYEAKSTTKVKPEHIHDVGLQTWIMAKSGLPLEKINLLHLNPDCRFPDLSNLFKINDVTESMRANYSSVVPKLNEIKNTLQQPNTPDVDLGPYCLLPNECEFVSHCWKEKNIPAISIFNLPGIKNHKWDLYHQNIIELDDPRLTDLSDIQQRMVDVNKTGQRFVDANAINNEMKNWQFPLVFLDFETINPAIPRYNGCGPYHHVPFQFSVHVWPDPKAEISHTAFLHDNTNDPRPTLIPALLSACGKAGSIVAYHSKFESERILEMAEQFTEYAEALTALTTRMVDPLPIIRNHVYDKQFAGSFSLKKVAPALLGDESSYKEMAIADGGAAQRGFEELINSKTSPHRREVLKVQMLDYCKKDTFVMVELVKWMMNEV